MSDAHAAAEAFALTPDPGAYVPSPERERALAQMASALTAGAVPCLEGPTGIGKTLLLQLLVQRVAERFDPLYLPYPMLSTSELCTLAIGLLGQGAEGNPEAGLLRLASERAARGRPLVLLIDDAASLPPDSARGLAALCARSGGALRLALAGIAGPMLADVTAAFGDTLLRVALEERIPRAELREYVAAQLEHASAPVSLRRAFDDAVLEELERAASGNPRRLHLAAQSIVRRAETRPAPDSTAPDSAAPDAPAPDAAETSASAPAIRVAAPPPSAPPPARAAPPVHEEPIGEYRVVRRRAPAQPADPAREVTAAPEAPPPRSVHVAGASPPDAVPPAAPLPTPPWQEPSIPATAARPRERAQIAPAAVRAPRRVPTVPAYFAVALVSAALGFALATRLREVDAPASRVAPASAERTAPATRPTMQTPTDPLPQPESARVVAPPTAATAAVPAPPPPVMIEISVNASPWALLEIDGREVGETPIGGIAVERGVHRFVARFPDGRIVERTVEIDAEHRTLVFE